MSTRGREIRGETGETGETKPPASKMLRAMRFDEIWRPENSPWSGWVKPVIFPFLRPGCYGRDEYSVQAWQVALQPDTTIIADLPGAEGVSAGIALARAGYMPVLVYNACPNGAYAGSSPESVSILNSQPASSPW
jgi:hypothetical protein